MPKMLMQPAKLAAKPYPVFSTTPNISIENCRHFSRQLRLVEEAPSAYPNSIVERKPKMEEIETVDNLDDPQMALRGASQVLQALAATPDCVETGECLTLVSDVIESAARCIETAKDALD